MPKPSTPGLIPESRKQAPQGLKKHAKPLRITYCFVHPDLNNEPKTLLDQIRDVIRIKHYSTKTEQVYIHWVRSYTLFHKKRHPKDMGAPEIKAFLTYLAVDQKVAAQPRIKLSVQFYSSTERFSILISMRP